MNWCVSFCMFESDSSFSIDFVCLGFGFGIDEASKTWQKQSPEPCYTNAGLQQTSRDRRPPPSMPSEALRLHLWSPWSERQIHNKICCPSVIRSHQSQEDSSQVALILLSCSWDQIDSRHLRLLHRQAETHRYTHQRRCRFIISAVTTRGPKFGEFQSKRELLH